MEYVLRFGATHTIRNREQKEGFRKLAYFLVRVGGSVSGVEKVRLTMSFVSSLTIMYMPWIKIV